MESSRRIQKGSQMEDDLYKSRGRVPVGKVDLFTRLRQAEEHKPDMSKVFRPPKVPYEWKPGHLDWTDHAHSLRNVKSEYHLKGIPMPVNGKPVAASSVLAPAAPPASSAASGAPGSGAGGAPPPAAGGAAGGGGAPAPSPAPAAAPAAPASPAAGAAAPAGASSGWVHPPTAKKAAGGDIELKSPDGKHTTATPGLTRKEFNEQMKKDGLASSNKQAEAYWKVYRAAGGAVAVAAAVGGAVGRGVLAGAGFAARGAAAGAAMLRAAEPRDDLSDVTEASKASSKDSAKAALGGGKAAAAPPAAAPPAAAAEAPKPAADRKAAFDSAMAKNMNDARTAFKNFNPSKEDLALYNRIMGKALNKGFTKEDKIRELKVVAGKYF